MIYHRLHGCSYDLPVCPVVFWWNGGRPLPGSDGMLYKEVEKVVQKGREKYVGSFFNTLSYLHIFNCKTFANRSLFFFQQMIESGRSCGSSGRQ